MGNGPRHGHRYAGISIHLGGGGGGMVHSTGGDLYQHSFVRGGDGYSSVPSSNKRMT